MKHEGKLLGALATPMNRMSAKLTSPWRMFLDGSRNEIRCLKKKKKKKKKKSLDKFLIVTILDDISLVNYSEDLLVHIFLLHF